MAPSDREALFAGKASASSQSSALSPTDTQNLLLHCRSLFRNAYSESTIDLSPDAAWVQEKQVQDWIIRHRMQGLFAPLFPGLQNRLRGQAFYTARLTMLAEQLCGRFRNSLGNACFLIKGPVLAAQAWPASGLRSFDDLDFRCPQTAIDEVHAGLTAAGFQPLIDSDLQRSHYWHFGWGLTYRHADGFWAEVNHRLFVPHFPCPKQFTSAVDMQQWCVPVQLDSEPVLAPDPALHLIIACLHAVWHGGERLAWFMDIAGLIQRHPNILATAAQWEGMNEFARRCLRIGHTIANHWFTPDPMGQHEQQDAELGTVLGMLQQSLISGKRLTTAEQHHLHLTLLSPPARSIVSLRRALTPGDGDFRAIELPERWRGLYWLLRPLRFVNRRMSTLR